jgi:hypothetical protein
LSSTSGTPMETLASSGTVTFSSIPSNAGTVGTFALAFGSDHLNGTFDAVFCAAGVEP